MPTRGQARGRTPGRPQDGAHRSGRRTLLLLEDARDPWLSDRAFLNEVADVERSIKRTAESADQVHGGLERVIEHRRQTILRLRDAILLERAGGRVT